jgi:predicted RNase H-like HicB family nuclease
MLTAYLKAAATDQARYEILSDTGKFYGGIPGFDRVYANARSLESCRDELREVLEDWGQLRMAMHLLRPQAG